MSVTDILQEPLISIIVPVYKAENYLNKCVESIILQNYKRWELLLVNDGSPDSCGVLCDNWAKRDDRIRVLHKANGGVSSARNMGLEFAKGDWICFIDSDDYVDEEYLNNLFSPIDTHTDLVYANYDTYTKIPYDISLDIKSAIDFMIVHDIFNMSGPVAKLYRANLIRDFKISFPIDIHMGEDAIFNIRFLNVANRVAFTQSNNYHYIPNQGSLSSKYYNFESEYNAYKIWKKEELILFSKYCTPDKALKMTWNIRGSDQFNRVLQCVYRFKPSYSIVNQYHYLRDIDITDIQEYEKYYHPKLWRRKINKFLIIHKMFHIYILVSLFDCLIYKK